jgi:putative ABC transport system permease protein
MNLAWKDIRRQTSRFLLTGIGLGLLFSIVLAMGGIYRGLVVDATQLVDQQQTDLWVVQRDTRGPFAERSIVPLELEDRLRAVPGVARTRSFTYATLQRGTAEAPLRLTLLGVAWPEERGQALPLVAGRGIEAAHWEMIADESLGLSLDERVPIGQDTWTVVGLTRGVVGSGGDGLAMVTRLDAAKIIEWRAPETIRDEREARARRLENTELSSPSLDARVRDDRAALPVLPAANVNAILVDVADGADESAVLARLSSMPEVTVWTTEDQRQFLLRGVVDKARAQIGLFRVLLAIVSSIIVALVLYNMTVAKSREIALLKLMGARTRVVVGLVLQQALLLGLVGYGVAVAIGQLAFEHFPRRVIVTDAELLGMAGLVLGLCTIASIAGIRRALAIPATEILAG